MSGVAYAWDMAGRAIRHTPKKPCECGRCEEAPAVAFVVVPGVEMEEWMCQGCIDSLDWLGVEFHEVDR